LYFAVVNPCPEANPCTTQDLSKNKRSTINIGVNSSWIETVKLFTDPPNFEYPQDSNDSFSVLIPDGFSSLLIELEMFEVSKSESQMA